MGVAGMPMTSMNNAQAPPLAGGVPSRMRVVGKIITGELRVAEFHDKVRYVVASKDRERRIRIILEEAVLSLTPERNEVAGLHMSSQARGTISEADGDGIHSAQNELSFAEAHILR